MEAESICTLIGQYIPDHKSSEKLCTSQMTYNEKLATIANYCFANNLYDEAAIFKRLSFKKEGFLKYLTSLQKCINKQFYGFVKNNINKIEDIITKYEHNYKPTYNSLKRLENGYLLKGETPEYLFMRVAIAINMRSDNPFHSDNIELTYKFTLLGYYIHATPTLMNAGMRRQQLSSCFVMSIADDIESISKSWHEMALISRAAGGIAINKSNIRAKGSEIESTGHTTNGISKWIQVDEKIADAVDQGGKRKGAISEYCQIWHADIEEFIDLKLPTGDDSMRARGIFPAVLVPDLFMKRLLSGDYWTLFCPSKCPDLVELWGDEFEKRYQEYEEMDLRTEEEILQNVSPKRMYKKRVPAMALMGQIIQAQKASGTPYIMFCDHVNRKTNHQNLGTIKLSNLCTEIYQYTSVDETAVCNLVSICLPKCIVADSFFKKNNKIFDYDKLIEITRIAARNANKVIDVNECPTIKCEKSNKTHRAIGIGIQGFADVLNILRIPYESDAALYLVKAISETIYFAALTESCELAQLHTSYKSFKPDGTKDSPVKEDSPFAKGILQYHMWGYEEEKNLVTYPKLNWKELIENIKEYGTRNSLLTAYMPTVSTAHITGCSESFEPYEYNYFVKKDSTGETKVYNPYLVEDLKQLKLWNNTMIKKIVENRGSIQNIKEIPDDIKALYKTIYEINTSTMILYAAARGPFIDQGQSLNLYIQDKPNNENITVSDRIYSAHILNWKSGNKGSYYVRVESTKTRTSGTKQTQVQSICKIKPGTTAEGCLMCQ